MLSQTPQNDAAASRILELENELREFSYIVSHDLMASFRHINGFVGILEDDLGDDLTGPQQANFARVKCAAGACNAMLEELLVYSRAQQRTLDLADCSAASLVDAARLQLGQRARASGAQFVVGALDHVCVDQELMTHAFKRIFDNAIKFRRPDTPPCIEISLAAEGDDWVAHVSDNGRGLETDDPEKLFRMFYRCHPKDDPGGVGAGLAISRRILRRHGGDLRFLHQDRGACVEMRLPSKRRLLAGDSH